MSDFDNRKIKAYLRLQGCLMCKESLTEEFSEEIEKLYAEFKASPNYEAECARLGIAVEREKDLQEDLDAANTRFEKLKHKFGISTFLFGLVLLTSAMQFNSGGHTWSFIIWGFCGMALMVKGGLIGGMGDCD